LSIGGQQLTFSDITATRLQRQELGTVPNYTLLPSRLNIGCQMLTAVKPSQFLRPDSFNCAQNIQGVISIPTQTFF
jgi:hypothetical protein